jgi:hypothetical protein
MKRATLPLAALTWIVAAGAVWADIPLTDGEVKCVLDLNKRGAKVAAAQGKQNRYCVHQAGKGKIPAEDACLEGDAKGKIEGARTKTTDSFANKCVDVPDLGPTSADAVNDAFENHARDLARDIFGDLAIALILAENDKAGAQCQSKIMNWAGKILDTKLKTYVLCKNTVGKAPIAAAADLAACVTPGGIAEDAKGKIAKKVTTLGDDIEGKCADVDITAALPGACAGETGTALRDCIDALAECRACLAINAADGLSVDCSTFAGITCPPSGGGLDCGNGDWDIGEECDPTGGIAACPDHCLADCTCSDTCDTTDVARIGCPAKGFITISMSCQTPGSCDAFLENCAGMPSCTQAAQDACMQLGCLPTNLVPELWCQAQCVTSSGCCP